jgi:hypothetical protein
MTLAGPIEISTGDVILITTLLLAALFVIPAIVATVAALRKPKGERLGTAVLWFFATFLVQIALALAIAGIDSML